MNDGEGEAAVKRQNGNQITDPQQHATQGPTYQLKSADRISETNDDGIETRTPREVMYFRGVSNFVLDADVMRRIGNQILLKTRAPLVPPNPKLFFNAISILASRAVFAQ